MFTIHPLSTGTVRIKQAMQRGVGTGLRRRSGLFRPGAMTGPLPIHVWAIEHDDGLILVDAGEVSTVRDQAFATFDVTREQELDRALEAAGFAPADVATVVLTHIHGDHIGGLPHVPQARVLAGAEELRVARGLGARIARRALHQPLPPGFDAAAIELDGPAFGAFAASAPITADGRVLAVPAPGHTPGHLAVIVVQDGHHVLLGGDSAYEQAQLLELHVDAVSPRADVARATMETIIEHGRRHPTVYLPSHDPQSAARLAATEALAVA
jgi:glyoxylase-like metal-dependent hydrolase (beta-lactamase superfamily II)